MDEFERKHFKPKKPVEVLIQIILGLIFIVFMLYTIFF
jgi:hypothetical protein